MDVSEILKRHQDAKLEAAGVTKEDDLVYDLGNLAAFDTHPLDIAEYKRDAEGYINRVSRDNVQLLVNQLFSLPSEPAEIGRVIDLPAQTTTIPREKPLPKARELTRWEKFAQSKGIVKKKRSRMELDEATGEYKPTWGRGKANNPEEQWAIPAKPTDELGTDPFEQMKKDKKERLDKQKKHETRNRGETPAAPATPAPIQFSSTVKEFDGAAPAKKPRKEALENAYQIANVSTASLGKFDQRSAMEEAVKVKHQGKFRKFEPNVPQAGLGNEKKKSLDVLDKIISTKEKLDATKAASIVQAHEEASNRKKHIMEAKSKLAGRGGTKREKAQAKRD